MIRPKIFIADDHPILVKGLEDLLIEKGYEVVGTATNGQAAMNFILKQTPDIAILDVEMPFGNAFDLLEQLEVINFETVFVTAYSQYALKALNYSASYYILKPIDIDELESSIKKVRENIEIKNEGSFT